MPNDIAWKSVSLLNSMNYTGRQRAYAPRRRAVHVGQQIDASFLATVVSSVDRGVLVEDAGRRVLAVNTALGDLFGVAVHPARIVHTRLVDQPPPGGAGEAAAWALLLRETSLVPGTSGEVKVAGGRILERIYRQVTVDGVACGHFWAFRDQSEAYAAEREVAMLKGRFISVVSHELRTPLTSIATFTEMLNAAGTLRPDEVPGALAAIQRNTERMLTLLEDLALLARLECGGEPAAAPPVTVEMEPLLDAAAGLLQAFAPGLTTHVYIASGPPVRGDPRLIRELLMTMASAVAACSAGGEAYVSARADEAEWTVSMGVTEAQDVTNELLLGTRLPGADTSAPPRSVALAMLLARAIATNQGGELRTSSEAPDNLTLNLRLPIRHG